MPLLTAKELAVELSMRPKQVRMLSQTGRIPAMRFASEWRFDLEQVKAASQYVNPIQRDARATARRLWMGGRRPGERLNRHR